MPRHRVLRNPPGEAAVAEEEVAGAEPEEEVAGAEPEEEVAEAEPEEEVAEAEEVAEGAEDVEHTEEKLKRMLKSELLSLCEEKGIECDQTLTKAEIIERILGEKE